MLAQSSDGWCQEGGLGDDARCEAQRNGPRDLPFRQWRYDLTKGEVQHRNGRLRQGESRRLEEECQRFVIGASEGSNGMCGRRRPAHKVRRGPPPVPSGMRADVKSIPGERLGRVEIDEAARPVRVRPPQADRDLYLDWEGALDDAGHLRSCVACGHDRLYRSRTFPQLTPFVVMFAFAGATIGILGASTNPIVVCLLAILLVLDVGVLLLARPLLVCYRCGTVYDRLSIARYHRRWESAVAERQTAGLESTENAETST